MEEKKDEFVRLDGETASMVRDLMRELKYPTKIECIRHYIRQGFIKDIKQ